MLEDRTIALMREFNPWWEREEAGVDGVGEAGRGTGAGVVPEYRRRMFSDVWKYVSTKQVIAVVGLRRVGKTVLMKQVIRELRRGEEVSRGEAGEKVDGKNILYFLFDDLLVQKPEILEDILNYYLKNIAGKGRRYIFLDEIQKVPHWQDIVKRFYDTQDDLKFMVSGSASLQIKKSKESLAGRIFDFHLPILTFREFLELNGVGVEKPRLEFGELKKAYEANMHKKPVFEKKFRDYIMRGAFPEIAKEEDERIIKNYIKSSVLEKIIFEDIPLVFKVEKKDLLYAALEYCGNETSNLLEISNLAKALGVNYQTMRSYIFYLQKSFLIDLLYNYSRSSSRRLRKNKKVHIAHPSIAMTIMNHPSEILDASEVIGRYVETIVFEHSKLLSEKQSFWRTSQKEEVDILLELKSMLPIEVKYKANIAKSDLKNLKKSMAKFKSELGILVTRDTLEEKTLESGKKILLLPAWLFLLAV